MLKKRVTLRHVAEACGVTPAAVSYALRGSPEVSEALRTRILETATRLGYVPSGAARQLRGVAPRRIGIVAPIPGMPTYARNIEALDRVCALQGVETVVHYHYWHQETERQILRRLLDSGISGLVVHPSGTGTKETLVKLAKGGLLAPFVVFGDVAPDSALKPFLRGRYHLQPQQMADLCIPRVMEQGHRRLAILLQGPLLPEGNWVQILRRFYQMAVRKQGVEVEFFYLDDSSSPIRQKVLRDEACNIHDFVLTNQLLAQKFLESGSEATVAITQDDLTALALLNGCQERGRSVPEELSILGLGGSFACSLGVRPISHMAVEIDTIAADVMERLNSATVPDALIAPYPLVWKEGATFGKSRDYQPARRGSARTRNAEKPSLDQPTRPSRMAGTAVEVAPSGPGDSSGVRSRAH